MHDCSQKEEFKIIKTKMDNLVSKELLSSEFNGLRTFIGEKFNNNDEGHARIENQVITTNGRVKLLEFWRIMLIGAWAVTTILFPVLFFYYSKSVQYETKEQILISIEENNKKILEANK